MALTADHLVVIGRGQLLADMSVKDFISHNSADFARVRTPDDEPQQREKLTAALTEAGGQVLPEQDGALRVTGLAAAHQRPRARRRTSGCGSCHRTRPRWRRRTCASRRARSTTARRRTSGPGLQQPAPPGMQPPQPMPMPGQGQSGWYPPPGPQQGGQPFAMPQQPAGGPYSAPGPQPGGYGAPPRRHGAPSVGASAGVRGAGTRRSAAPGCRRPAAPPGAVPGPAAHEPTQRTSEDPR